MTKRPNSSRPQPSSSGEQSVSSLYREFVLLRKDFEFQGQQFGRLEKLIESEHEAYSKQFQAINEQLGQLVRTTRVEDVEKKIVALERRNDRLDGAALAAKGVWFIIGGLIVGLLVAWLK